MINCFVSIIISGSFCCIYLPQETTLGQSIIICSYFTKVQNWLCMLSYISDDLVLENFLPELVKIHGCTKACVYLLQGDADIFFPTDRLLDLGKNLSLLFWVAKTSWWPFIEKRKEKDNNYGVFYRFYLSDETLSNVLCFKFLATKWFIFDVARNIIFHGGVWFAHKNKNQGWIQPTLGWLQEYQILS